MQEVTVNSCNIPQESEQVFSLQEELLQQAKEVDLEIKHIFLFEVCFIFFSIFLQVFHRQYIYLRACRFQTLLKKILLIHGL